ncbi:F-box/LRR-repeat protein At3g58900-like isoform X4 [Coffea eugenioides]|uniref:F-box/LRR-repeat protein At3g58900-like isoform X4 n=1 Tax=Coffea eugenioides TaxID=49369 RepID=UPI000F60635D|nr:F-box/LRR-repeat protein At3g58900-like isoform X4 [Coffea eugenioides]XP_027155223.1 F-box/LRR-repeat protein At3g58900-like isoform X4 [Coffea eugenioides]
MESRAILATGFGPRKCAKIGQPLKDQISRLPDEILVYILSCLTLKEAARTSVLSKRWIDLWRSMACLDFDASKVLKKMFSISSWGRYADFVRKERCKYVEWVDKVLLQSDKSLALDDLRVAFCLDNFYGDKIHKWLQHAFARRVQRLELNLFADDDPPSSQESYTFHYELFCLSSGQSQPGYSEIHHHAQIGFKSLRALSLKSLNVTGEVLEFFLINCPFLERLVVEASSVLINLRVCGPSIALKYLEEKGIVHELPQLTNLKEFVLIASASKDHSLIGFTSLIRASPNLEKFVLKLESWWDDMVRRDRKLKKAASFPLQHLKVVELLGYYGRRSELELVEYFLENAIVLEKLIIDPRDPRNVTWPKTRKERKQEKKQEKLARICAKQQIEGLIPSHIEFSIL